MGGRGSSRWGAKSVRRPTRECPAIDINYLKRHGYLEAPPGERRRRPVGLFVGDRLGGLAIVSVTGMPDGYPIPWDISVTFSYRGHTGTQKIELDQTEANFEGDRPWFVCPACRKRRAVLRLAGTYEQFRCNSCNHVAYSSTRKAVGDRVLSRAHEAAQRLGLPPGDWYGEEIPPKPKGMHQKTYQRLEEDINRATNALYAESQRRDEASERFIQQTERFIERMNR